MSEVVRVRAPRWTLLRNLAFVAPLVPLTLNAWFPPDDWAPGAWARVAWVATVIFFAVVVGREAVRPVGVDLTADAAVVVDPFRTREVPWRDVQAVTIESWSTVLHRSSGRPVRLFYPGRVWFVPSQRRFEADFHRVGQWWLAHRGPDWRPAAPPRSAEDVWRTPPESRS
jgi:hypothetical protein